MESYSELFDAQDEGDATVVRTLADAIRHPPQALALSEDLSRLVEQDRRTRLVVNMGATHYLGSTGFAVLFGLARKLEAAGGRMALCALSPDVLVGANILGLGTVIPIYETEDEALRALQS